MKKPAPTAKKSRHRRQTARALPAAGLWSQDLQRLLQRRHQLLEPKPPASEIARLFPQLNQLQGADGQWSELAGLFRQAQTLLHQYTELFDLAPVGYVVLDPKGKIQEINCTGAHLLGQPRARLLGRLFSGFVIKEDAS